MSGYSSRAEVVDMLRSGIRTDYNGLGYPREPERFNMAGIVRDLFYNSGAYGWRPNDDACDRGQYEETLRRHYRAKHRASRQERPSTHVGRRRTACSCARHADGSVTTFLCPIHADIDPCLTMARATGLRRTGTIRRGVCTSCGHRAGVTR